MAGVTAVLNGFQRHDALTLQIEALENSTIKPVEILLHYNKPDNGSAFNTEAIRRCKSFVCNHNWGVWARFATALNATSEFVCVFDDDTIPGTRWLEHCLETFREYPGILGTSGHVYNVHDGQPDVYENLMCVGWKAPNNAVLQVDIVGHSWFFPREWLPYLWLETPDPFYWNAGEDIWLSFMCQKYLGVKTFVPIHPETQPEFWGSTQGWGWGKDSNSLWESDKDEFRSRLGLMYQQARKRGWKIVMDDA